MSDHDATFYVQVEPTFANYLNRSGDRDLRSIRAVRLTQDRPRQQKPGTVMVKLTVRVPDAAFYPLRPEAIVVVPEDMTAAEPLVVEASDANQDGA